MLTDMFTVLAVSHCFRIGGLEGLAKLLEVDLKNGLTAEQVRCFECSRLRGGLFCTLELFQKAHVFSFVHKAHTCRDSPYFPFTRRLLCPD